MSKNDFNNLKAWLTQKMDERGLTVEDLARTAQISRALIYNWMNDTWRPTHNTMPKVVKALNEAPVYYNDAKGNTQTELRTVSLEEAYAQYSQRKLGRPANSGGARQLAVRKR